jgi:FixJ family two-component response regulator
MTESGGIVFVVDDDPSMRESLRNLVRPIGLRVQVFASVQESSAAHVSTGQPANSGGQWCSGADLGNHPDGGR